MRDRFAKPDGIYLLNHSIGLPPVNARAAAEAEYFNSWEHNTPDAWPRWIESIDKFRTALAALLNSPASNFCPQMNLSSALTKVLYALPHLSERPTILLSEQDFPSIGFVLDRATPRGYRLKFIPAQRDAGDPGIWDEHLTPDVGLALITHVQSNTSRRLPVSDLADICRERDTVSIVDVAQSAGIVPIDLASWDADFVIGSCVKWLCGGPGAGFLWVHPDIVEQCKPVDVGWFSHADPFEFDIHHFKYSADALRFWGGTPSVLPFVVARNSIELIHAIGVDAIYAHNQALTQKIEAAVDVDVLVSKRDPKLRGGTLVLNFGAHQAEITGKLSAARIHCDTRATGIRVSPHIYNTTGDIDALIDCLAD